MSAQASLRPAKYMLPVVSSNTLLVLVRVRVTSSFNGDHCIYACRPDPPSMV